MTSTTIKIHEETKMILDNIKKNDESYEDAIKRLISESKRSNLREKLIEGYKKRSEESLEILKEWENSSNELNEW